MKYSGIRLLCQIDFKMLFKIFDPVSCIFYREHLENNPMIRTKIYLSRPFWTKLMSAQIFVWYCSNFHYMLQGPIFPRGIHRCGCQNISLFCSELNEYSPSCLFAVISFWDLPRIKKSADKYLFAVYNITKPRINIYPRIFGKNRE